MKPSRSAMHTAAARASTSPARAEPRDHAPSHRRHAERPPPLRRILIVDDSRVARELLKVYLIARDVELLEAADGFEAMDVIRSRRPDVVLADVRMPRLDGIGLCAALQADPGLAGTPVLILTAGCDGPTELRLREAGAREVLRKPIQPEPLRAALARHLPLRGPREAHPTPGARAAT